MKLRGESYRIKRLLKKGVGGDCSGKGGSNG